MIPLERQQAYVAMDLQEWRQMELLTDDLLARSPEDLSEARKISPRSRGAPYVGIASQQYSGDPLG